MFVTHTKARLSTQAFHKVSEFRKTGTLPHAEPLKDIANKKSSTCSEFRKRARPQAAPSLSFKHRQDRGDFPISASFNGANRALKWLVDLGELDLAHYLPLFVAGLSETEEPYVFMAEQACLQSIAANGHKLVGVIPEIVFPLKKSLDSKNMSVVLRAIKILQAVVQANSKTAESLIPYFKNILPAFNRHLVSNKNLGDFIEYSQQTRTNIGDIIVETLTLLEVNGGQQAFVHIKYMIPVYESQVKNR